MRNIHLRKFKGQSLVEFALVLPLFVYLMLIMFVYGLIFWMYVDMGLSVRASFLRAAYFPDDDAKIEKILRDGMPHYLDQNLLKVTITDSGDRETNSTIYINITYDLKNDNRINALGGLVIATPSALSRDMAVPIVTVEDAASQEG